MSVIKPALQVKTKLTKALHVFCMQLKLKIHSVEYGKRLRGNRPFIKNTGRIKLGNNVSLNSYPGGEMHTTGLQTHLREASIEVGDNCHLNGAMIHCRTSVKIGAYCLFGPGTKIVDNNSHRVAIDPLERRKSPQSEPINIESNVWVGMDSLILKGVTIGENSIVAAHSVVTKTVPKNVIVAGNPAKVIRSLDDVSRNETSG